MFDREMDSREIAEAAIRLAMTDSREAETAMKAELAQREILCAAVDYGGVFDNSVLKMIERTVAACKRDGLSEDHHHELGAVAGAAREAISQIAPKALGLNIGGKIGIARRGEHLAVALFFTVGLIHLNEICIGLGHRTI